MKIKFKKKRLYINLILGLVWLALGILNLTEDDKIRWTDYGYLVAGILYIGHYLYDLTNQYLTIENGTIRKNGLYGFGKQINLNEINWIKKFAGDYTLKTHQRELKINTELIDKDSLTELNKILTELNLPPEKTPFANNV
ncbi:hypothetical protein [Neotamlana laminarinivorans]|uniref:Uncharacterized protein n=1 Tax=Neotamlana laminarinivorans TaxID=2883124 RepID=A0A9X1I361_9FLAO|nr:hypothetical protein [Tamlana laminarinivorans]MCB4800301.1 hypothetical protein [Tamlana laminarinivorans]